MPKTNKQGQPKESELPGAPYEARAQEGAEDVRQPTTARRTSTATASAHN